MELEYMGYRIRQSDEDYHSVEVWNDEKEVMHFSVTKCLSEGELIEAVETCLKIVEKVRMEDYVFGDDTFYDGDEPC